MSKFKYTRKKKGKGCRTILIISISIVSLCFLSWLIPIVSDWNVFKDFLSESYQFLIVEMRSANQKKKEESAELDSLQSTIQNEFPSEDIFITIGSTFSENAERDYVYVISIELINPDFLGNHKPSDFYETTETIAKAIYTQYPHIDDYEIISIMITKKSNTGIIRTEASSTSNFRVDELEIE